MRLLQPLRHRSFGLLWGGLALSAIGDQAYNVAFAWIATEAFGTRAGFLAAVGPLAQLAMLALGGGVADALPPGQAMVWADGVRALALLLVVAAWQVSGQAPAAALVVAVGVLGAGMAVFRPALQAVVPSLVPDRGLLPAANALLDVTERLARLVGPALAGVLSAVLPLQHLLTLDAFTFVASGTALWAIGRRNPVLPVRAVRAAGVLAAILHGVRAARAYMVGSQTGLLAALVLAPALLAVLPLPGVIAVCGVAILGCGVVGLQRFG